MERYVKFDTEAFLKDALKWKKEKKKLEEDLSNLVELPAIQNSEVHAGHISDPTFSAAKKRLKITSQIDRIQHYEDVLNYGLSHISDINRRLIEGFYLTQGKFINKIIDEFCEDFDCSPRTVYRMKRAALEKFSAAIRK